MSATNRSGVNAISYILSVLIIMEINIILAMSLNLVMGYGGMISLTHGAFMGVGGYAAALLAVKLGLNMTWGLLLGGVAAGLLALAFGYFSLRIKDEGYILASFAFQMLLVEILFRWSGLTGGSHGLRGIPRPQLFGLSFSSLPAYFWFVTILTVLLGAIILYIGRSPFGLVVRGIREGVRAVEAVGRNTLWFQLRNFVVGGAVAGLAGGLHVGLVKFTYPGEFGINTSILLIVFVVVGGIGNLWGTLVGTAIITALPQLLSFMPFVTGALQAPLQQILYGALLMIFIWIRPQGIIGERPIVFAAAGRVNSALVAGADGRGRR